MAATYITLVAFSKIVREVALNFFNKLVSVFWVKVKHFKESFENNALEVTVGESFHIGIRFNHLVLNREVCTN